MATLISTSGPTQTPDRKNSAPAVAILICTIVTVMEGYSLIVFGSVIPLLLTDGSLGITPQSAGVLGSLVYVGMFFGAILAGIIGDRVGRQPVLVAAIALFALGGLVAGLADSATGLGFARLLSGLGVGGAVTTALALARNHAPANRSSLVVNITMAGIPLGGTIAALLGIWLLPLYGWRVMFFVGAALTTVILLIVLIVRLEDRHAFREAKASAPTRDSSLKLLFSGRGSLIAILIAAVAVPNMFTWFGLNVWLTATMNALNFPLASALLFSLTLTAGAVIGSLATAFWADRWGALRVGTVTALFTVVGLVGAVWVGSQSLPALLVFIALMGAGGHSTMNLLNAATSNLFAPQIRGTAIGWANGISYFGAFGPIAGGLVLSSAAGPGGVFVLFGGSAVLAFVATGLFAAVTRKQHA